MNEGQETKAEGKAEQPSAECSSSAPLWWTGLTAVASGCSLVGLVAIIQKDVALSNLMWTFAAACLWLRSTADTRGW